jgi:hypothetical protein
MMQEREANRNTNDNRKGRLLGIQMIQEREAIRIISDAGKGG